MKIAVNTRFLLSDQLEGIGWYTFELLQKMVLSHPEDEFIFFFDRPFDPKFHFAKNITPIVLAPQARHPILWYWWFEISLAQALKKHKADVFLSPDGYLSLSSKIKTVMVTHDIAHIYFPEQIYFTARKYYQKMVPKFLKRANKIVTVSEFTKVDILKHYAIEEEKIKTIYNGCRAEFKPLPADEKGKIKAQYADGHDYFFYVGAVQPRKNIHRLIAAFDQFKSSTGSAHKLLIGGRFAWQTGAVKSAYDLSSYQQDITFLGYLPNEEVPRLMGASLALTYVSLFEGFGLPLVEAMQSEVPFITSNISSMPEVAGNAGIKVNPESIDEISAAMVKIATDQTAYTELVAAGKIQRKKFNWAAAADLVYAELKKLTV